MTSSYVSPVYEVRSFDGELMLTVRYADDDPSAIELVAIERVVPSVSIFLAPNDVPALIEALRRISRNQPRDEADMDRAVRKQRKARHEP